MSTLVIAAPIEDWVLKGNHLASLLDGKGAGAYFAAKLEEGKTKVIASSISSSSLTGENLDLARSPWILVAKDKKALKDGLATDRRLGFVQRPAISDICYARGNYAFSRLKYIKHAAASGKKSNSAYNNEFEAQKSLRHLGYFVTVFTQAQRFNCNGSDYPSKRISLIERKEITFANLAVHLNHDQDKWGNDFALIKSVDRDVRDITTAKLSEHIMMDKFEKELFEKTGKKVDQDSAWYKK